MLYCLLTPLNEYVRWCGGSGSFPPKNKCLSNTHSHACCSRYILHKHTDMPTVIKIYRQQQCSQKSLCVCVRGSCNIPNIPKITTTTIEPTDRPTYKMPIITNINLSEANNTTASQRSFVEQNIQLRQYSRSRIHIHMHIRWIFMRWLITQHCPCT